METIYKLFYDRTRLSRNNTAVNFNGMSYTYWDLFVLTEKIAAGLYDSGIKKGTVVGVLFPNSLDIIAVFYALQRLGAVPALLNYRLNSQELSLLCKKADCTYLIYSDCYRELADGIRRSTGDRMCFVSSENHEELTLRAMKDRLTYGLSYSPEIFPDDTALYLFTGGTLALPKIARITHQALFLRTALRFIAGNIDYHEDDNYLIFNPIFHQGGISQVMFMLSAGGSITILSEMRPAKIAKAIEDYKVTIMLLLPPSLCARLKESPSLLEYDRSSVRLVILTGGIASHQSVLDVFEIFPNAKLSIGYGHTEDAANVGHVFSKAEFLRTPHIANSIGKQRAFWDIRLVDEEGNDVATGEVGECLARSNCMLAEYLGQETFDKDGWLHTGDLLRRDEQGYYYFCGRCNDMIKSGGENVLAVEVELVINRHPDVEKCAVFGVSGGDLGEMVWAAVVKKSGCLITEDQLIQYVKENIAHYKAPKRVFFMEDLPVTSIGKTNKIAVKKACLEQNGKI